eukprot:TRINITY_DN5489_c0_g2_i1.p4 TRINITY_DN5489_c0_g2~~TRINITY_DN5489_c0_g2_i1.p4  ORF type:complete len:115 (-),score=0.06 TRINITY_DN5489_c0_g2_i1:295-639(-)
MAANHKLAPELQQQCQNNFLDILIQQLHQIGKKINKKIITLCIQYIVQILAILMAGGFQIKFQKNYYLQQIFVITSNYNEVLISHFQFITLQKIQPLIQSIAQLIQSIVAILSY